MQPYEGFQALVETAGLDRTNALLCAACEAFALLGKPTRAETEQITALARRLFALAGTDARRGAATSLARSAGLSPELEELVIHHLGDGVEDFLVCAPGLSEATMLNVVAGGDVNLATAIARRRDLSNAVLARLLRKNSRRVYRALATNTAILPRGPLLAALARAAQMDRQVAWSLAARDDFDVALLATAFFDLGEIDRIKVIESFARRSTPLAPIRRTLEQLSVATAELTRALMKLFSENRRPEVTQLLHQITALDPLRCGQIAHDSSGAALFVVLRAFGCNAHDGLKVLIHAISHDEEHSAWLPTFAKLFDTVSVDASAYLVSAWRGEVNLLDMTKPEYRPPGAARRRSQTQAARDHAHAAERASDALVPGAARAG